MLFEAPLDSTAIPLYATAPSMTNILKPAKAVFILSMLLAAASLALIVAYGPKLSIEFTGGTRMEIRGEGITRDGVESAMQSFGSDLSHTVNATQGGTFLIRTVTLEPETHALLLEHLQTELGAFDEEQYTTIGPTVGASLRSRAVAALFVASLGIILYIAWAFRKIPRKYNAWKFGVAAVVTLLHDIIITTGIFTVLSHVTSFEVDTLFVTALLTILGYSVNDTIVIFDRIRDNLGSHERGESFEILANKAVLQSMTRTFYTGISTLIMLFTLYFLGSESIRWFVLALIIGIVIGTYSSMFVATPLLVYWRKKA